MAKSVNEIVDLASAYYGSAVLFAAIDRGVFAAVEQSEQSNNRSIDQLAEICKCTRRGLRLLLDACVAEGLLEKNGET